MAYSMECQKCKGSGIVPDLGGPGASGYCDCEDGDKKMKDEMCTVCWEAKENCMCDQKTDVD